MSERITVAVVDDHPVFRLGLCALIERLDNIEVVGEAGSAEEAIAVVRELDPDVVIMDVQLGGPSGISATSALLGEDPERGVLVLTMFDDDDSVHAAIRAGARGYLVKGASPTEIERAIRAVANGEMLLGAPAARRMNLDARGAGRPFAQLTEREHEVLELVAAGIDNRAIARRLFLNEKTVRNHVSTVFTKLGVNTRVELVVKARENGLGTH